jgi:cell division protein ZapA (FtsZ GTPase activity inhibitor)
MNNEDEKGREHDLRQRIVSLIRANEQALKKPITDEEVQKLKAAAGRLDQMLKAAVNADGQVLKSAAARLDQLLEHIATGKDVTDDLKRRRNWQKRENG